MKIVAFVPVKLNSERTPGKTIKPFFDGTPLISFILNTLLQIDEIDEVYVFCSDPAIEKYLPQRVHFLQRPKTLDTPEATPQDIMGEFISKIPADIYVTSHATSPFVTAQHIRECVLKVLSGEYDSAFTAEKIQKLLWKDNKPMNFDAENVPRTQDLEKIYSEVSAAYVYRKEVFLNYRRRIGNKPYLCEVSGIECIDIDWPEDFEIADAVYEKIICGNTAEEGEA